MWESSYWAREGSPRSPLLRGLMTGSVSSDYSCHNRYSRRDDWDNTRPLASASRLSSDANSRAWQSFYTLAFLGAKEQGNQAELELPGDKPDETLAKVGEVLNKYRSSKSENDCNMEDELSSDETTYIPLYGETDVENSINEMKDVKNDEAMKKLSVDEGLGVSVGHEAEEEAFLYSDDELKLDELNPYLNFQSFDPNVVKNINQGSSLKTSTEPDGNAEVPHIHNKKRWKLRFFSETAESDVKVPDDEKASQDFSRKSCDFSEPKDKDSGARKWKIQFFSEFKHDPVKREEVRKYIKNKNKRKPSEENANKLTNIDSLDDDVFLPSSSSNSVIVKPDRETGFKSKIPVLSNKILSPNVKSKTLSFIELEDLMSSARENDSPKVDEILNKMVDLNLSNFIKSSCTSPSH